MEELYTYTISGESPKENCKVMSKFEIIEEIELDYKTQKIDLYNVIENVEDKKEFSKVCSVDEFTFEDFKK